MEFLISNFDLLLIGFIVAIGGFALLTKFVLHPKGKRYELVLDWLLDAVVLAEKRYGAKTGELKVAFVWSLFTTRFPVLKLFVTQEQFNKIVDEALEITSELIEEIKKKQVK